MAQELGVVHSGHHRRVQDQREPLSEQHDHPQAAQRRGLRLLQRPDDPDQGQAPEGHHVLPVFRSLSALPVRDGQFSERSSRRSHPGDPSPVPQLDPARLHLRDEADRDAHLQVLQCADVSQRHAEVLDRGRGRLGLALRRDVRHPLHAGHGSAGADAPGRDQHQGGLRQRHGLGATVHSGSGEKHFFSRTLVRV